MNFIKSSLVNHQWKMSMNRFTLNSFFLIFLATTQTVSAENIDYRAVKQYPNPMNLGWQYEVELDCNSKEESFIRSYDELNQVVIGQLKAHDIENDSNSQNALNISITDFSCDKNGLQDKFVSPLSLYTSNTISSAVILKINFEVERKDTGQILHSQEIIVISSNEEKDGNFMWFTFDKKVKEVSLRTAWGRAVEKIVRKTKEVLKNA